MGVPQDRYRRWAWGKILFTTPKAKDLEYELYDKDACKAHHWGESTWYTHDVDVSQVQIPGVEVMEQLMCQCGAVVGLYILR